MFLSAHVHAPLLLCCWCLGNCTKVDYSLEHGKEESPHTLKDLVHEYYCEKQRQLMLHVDGRRKAEGDSRRKMCSEMLNLYCFLRLLLESHVQQRLVANFLSKMS